MHELRGDAELTMVEALAWLSPCDIALIEGYKASSIPKLEIWRAGVGKPLLFPGDPHILAIATDSRELLPASVSSTMPILDLVDYDSIATLVIAEATPAPSTD